MTHQLTELLPQSHSCFAAVSFRLRLSVEASPWIATTTLLFLIASLLKRSVRCLHILCVMELLSLKQLLVAKLLSGFWGRQSKSQGQGFITKTSRGRIELVCLIKGTEQVLARAIACFKHRANG